MDPVPADKNNLQAAAAILRKGGLVAFPTETVYGLGADALNPKAVARIFEVKRRPAFDPLIVHVADAASAEPLAAAISPKARALMAAFWPGPLTLVLPKSSRVPDIVTAGLQTVAVRMPRHPVALDLIRAAGTPVAAPSANPFAYVSPTRAEHVAAQLGGEVAMILDGGACEVGLESTVLALEPTPVILRPGAIGPEEIERVIGQSVGWARAEGRPQAPGQLSRHYATQVPLQFLDPLRPLPAGRLGYIGVAPPADPERYAAVEALSASGDLREAAAGLFAALRRLDRQPLDHILAAPVPETGLGRAIMDRLRRCAASKKGD